MLAIEQSKGKNNDKQAREWERTEGKLKDEIDSLEKQLKKNTKTIKDLEGNKKDLTSEMAALRKGLKEVKQVQLYALSHITVHAAYYVLPSSSPSVVLPA